MPLALVFLEIVKYLVQHGNANVAAQLNEGWTALQIASTLDHLDIVNYLMDQPGANLQ
jgi:ankyrin repeat protein